MATATGQRLRSVLNNYGPHIREQKPNDDAEEHETHGIGPERVEHVRFDWGLGHRLERRLKVALGPFTFGPWRPDVWRRLLVF